ncbi:hypothetical protein TRFO_15773 [Tritrichomonas foetus]|uniref:RecA family profile 1 domain-containing protein n=1 Tax=Tritrichomonas foetus TaxID=1144522 RepID=A0A1J4KRI1_9EUKA|nr:hypothetical protein TRFO_15773 [Tritrichomonas foetus]|eukprot:OHT13897.1 hypothetical protein TRFO_15773 [Tritrichomonas foetus]
MEHRTALCLSLDGDQKKALLSHSIWTIDNLSDQELDDLANKIGIPKLITNNSPIPRRCEPVPSYKCGIESIDNKLSEILGGCLTEICGLPGSGRTTLCLRYAQYASQMLSNETLSGNTLWIDTEGCLFPPKGLKLAVIRIHDHLQLFSLTHRLKKIVDSINPAMIVVDSIAATMRGEASADSSRTALLWEFAKTLKIIAAERGIAVFITNHMSKIQFHGFVRTLGPSWQNVPTHCFELKSIQAGSRQLRIIKSPCLPRIDIEMCPPSDE